MKSRKTKNKYMPLFSGKTNLDKIVLSYLTKLDLGFTLGSIPIEEKNIL